MVALSAATPIYRGLLADVDARWDIISQVKLNQSWKMMMFLC
jgi:hypothetical protein